MKWDNLAFVEGPGGLRHQHTRFIVCRRKHEAEVSREERVSGSEGECCGIVTPAILCSVEQISNGTTCIFPSGCPKSQTAEGHLWKRLHHGSEKPFSYLPSGLVWSVTLHLFCQHQCLNVTFEEIWTRQVPLFTGMPAQAGESAPEFGLLGISAKRNHRCPRENGVPHLKPPRRVLHPSPNVVNRSSYKLTETSKRAGWSETSWR